MVAYKSSLLAAAAALSVVKADHLFTLVNNCAWVVNESIDNWSGTAYTGAQPPTIAAGASWSTTIPDAWDGRICDNRDCYGTYSLTEFNLDASGLSYYDISNIEGFSVGQQIVASGGDTLDCPASDCSCTQAYGVGNTAGTCSGSTVVDQGVRATATTNAAFTITYCPS